MNKISITPKDCLRQNGPYQPVDRDDYINHLEQSKPQLHSGDTAIYIKREILIDNDPAYFLYMDIDGEGNNEREKIKSAISQACMVTRILKKIAVYGNCMYIATGGTGFRVVSNLVVSKEYYDAYINFLEAEMSFLDFKPIRDIKQPHQLFAYRGNINQTSKPPVDRHSMIVNPSRILDNTFTVDDYLRETNSNPDPVDYIFYLETFLRFIRLNTTHGNLLNTLNQYLSPSSKFNFHLTDLTFIHKYQKSMALEEMSELLTENDINHKIENRGSRMAISFKNIECPVCGKRTVNAWAYPPHYTLRCHGGNCPANQGMPFHEWSKIDLQISNHAGQWSSPLWMNPTDYVDMAVAQNAITDELNKAADSIISATPGSGKTYLACKYLAQISESKLVLYSCRNRDQKEEAYQQYISMNPILPGHLLSSRDELCSQKDKLKSVANRGYPPAQYVCNSCPDRDGCQYYQERSNIKAGVYFCTHAMLPYLKKQFKDVDLVILDENLQEGLLNKYTCRMTDMQKLLGVLSNKCLATVTAIIDLANEIVNHYFKSGSQYTKLLLGDDIKMNSSEVKPDTILNILAKSFNETVDETKDRIKQVIKQLSASTLFRKNIDYKTKYWLKGLVEDGIFSYFQVGEQGAAFSYKSISTFPFTGATVKVLDATAVTQVVNRLLARTIVPTTIHVKWEGERIHFKRSASRVSMRGMTDKELKALLTKMIATISSQKVMVLTYDFMRTKIMEMCSAIDPSKEYVGFYYHGPRGINEFESCSAVMAIGLPYENPNESIQDSLILLDSDEAEDLSCYWTEMRMASELYQSIHRIRPIRTNNPEIVLASKIWPKCLGQPTNVIDQSKRMNRVESCVQRIKSIIDKVGFFNQDIGFALNMYVKTKVAQYNKFRSKVLGFVEDTTWCKVNSDAVHGKIIRSSFCADVNINVLYMMDIDKRLIIPIYNTKRDDYPFTNVLPDLKNIISSHNNDTTITLTSNQWSSLLLTVQTDYPTFDLFEVNLSHYGNQKIKGVGLKHRVIQFYTVLAASKIIKTFIPDKYSLLQPSSFELPSIPDNCFLAYYPDRKKDSNQYTSNTMPCSHTMDGVQDDIKTKEIVLTNDSWPLIDSLNHNAQLHQLQFHDITLIERIIQNKKYRPKITWKLLCDVYSLPFHKLPSSDIYQLLPIYEKQLDQIQKQGLQKIVNLEKQATRVLSKIDHHGLTIDADKIPDDTKQTTIVGIKKALQTKNGVTKYFYRSKVIGAHTGRIQTPISSLLKKPEIRAMIKAPKGYKLIEADYKAFEPRILMGLANDERGIELFNNGKDLYRELAAMMGVATDQLSLYRSVFKTVVNAIHNGGNEYTIRNILRANYPDLEAQAQQIYDVYFQMFANIRPWFISTISQARSSCEIRTHMGRRLLVDEATRDGTIVNFPIQGNASDIFKLALIELDKQLDESNARIIHTLHDAILLEVRSDLVYETARIVRTTMNNAFAEIISNIKSDVEIICGDDWGHCTTLTTPSLTDHLLPYVTQLKISA